MYTIYPSFPFFPLLLAVGLAFYFEKLESCAGLAQQPIQSIQLTLWLPGCRVRHMNYGYKLSCFVNGPSWLVVRRAPHHTVVCIALVAAHQRFNQDKLI